MQGLHADEHPEVWELFENVKASLTNLEKRLEESRCYHGYEDLISGLYHQSFEVYEVQEQTRRIVAALQSLAPERKLNSWFMQIVNEGTGRQFDEEDHQYWLEITRPMVEAYFHARYFLEMAVRYGKEFERPPQYPPSGWAAVVSLYEPR